MKRLIVEDCPLLRETLREYCSTLYPWDGVAIAGSAAEARERFAALAPDRLLLDLGLPDEDGFTVAEYALHSRPTTRVFVFSGHLNEYTISRCTQLRLHGFIDKNAALEELIAALRALAGGNTYFSRAYLKAKSLWHSDPYAFDKRLSATEQRVTALIARGCADEEIGFELGITRKTAETHRGKILRKLALPGTPKLIVQAIAHGFGSLG